jgi:IS30 family transposase
MTYTQLTPAEREVISHMVYNGATKTAIAQMIGRSVETVRRELQRNGDRGGYSAIAAQRRCEDRRRRARRASRKMERPEVGRRVKQYLRLCWSPDEIAGHLRQAHPANPDLHLSRASIYFWLRNDDHCRPFRSCLRRHGCRRRRQRPSGERRNSIAGRPEIIQRRERLGDWEGDLIVGCKQGGALLSLVERLSGLLLLVKVANRQSRTVKQAIVSAMQGLPPELRRSLTLDNGREFAAHAELAEQLGLEIYFADPRSPWQRGTNENTNGLVRQYFPKGTNFLHISPREVAAVQDQLNHRPRKRLGYHTPSEFLEPCVIATLQT